MKFIRRFYVLWMNENSNSHNLVPRVSVPLDQRSENESAGSNHFRHAQTAQWNRMVISFVISKGLLPELSFSDHWSRGTKTLGTRLQQPLFTAVKKQYACAVLSIWVAENWIFLFVWDLRRAWIGMNSRKKAGWGDKCNKWTSLDLFSCKAWRKR